MRVARFWAIWLLYCTVVLGVWADTGQDWFTKYQVVEERTVAADPDDPFSGTALYEDGMRTQAFTRDEFHLGLLPSGLGKHLISVLTFVLPAAIALLLVTWREVRQIPAADAGSSEPQADPNRIVL